MKEVDLKRIKPFLPHGSMGIIAGMANMKTPEVSRMLSGLITKETPKVIKALHTYLSESRKALDQIERELNATM